MGTTVISVVAGLTRKPQHGGCVGASCSPKEDYFPSLSLSLSCSLSLSLSSLIVLLVMLMMFVVYVALVLALFVSHRRHR
jgi:hypothetical protein